MWFLLLFFSLILAEIHFFHPKSREDGRLLEEAGLKRAAPGVWEGTHEDHKRLRHVKFDSYTAAPKNLVDPFAGYTTDAEITTRLRLYATEARGESSVIGMTAEGRPITAARLGPLRPNLPSIVYMGGIHGDEVVGPELVLRFAQHLVETDSTHLIQHANVYVLARMNPDGFHAQTRENAHRVDLNRNFWDQFVGEDAEPAVTQPETSAVMSWLRNVHPTLVVMLHGGATVCNYPYDGNQQHASNVYTGTPDDQLYRETCLAWASKNPDMTNNMMFDDGITNGADWYVLYGGLQDWAYLNLSAISVTTEVSNVKWPSGQIVISRYWPKNADGMIQFGWKVMQGLHAQILDKGTRQPLHATLHMEAGGIDVRSNSHGYVFRMLPVGTHSLLVTAPGYTGHRFEVEIGDSDLVAGTIELIRS